jgi:DNA-binding IclR family transcriptional regulator
MQDQRSQSDAARVASPAGAYTVMNTLRALERLAVGPHSAPEIATAVGVSVRTARRLLGRLAADGYAIQDAGHRRRYRATLRLAALGQVLMARSPIPAAVAATVRELASRTGAAAHLWVPAAGHLVCLVHADGADGRLSPVVAPREVVDAAGAAGSVLSSVARWRRSCAWARGDEQGASHASAAASVFDRDDVIAAVGISGDVSVADVPIVVAAALVVTSALADVTHLSRT